MALLSELMKRAETRPLRTCVKEKKGLEVGIPPKLLTYRDKLFDLLKPPINVCVEIGTLQGWFAWRCMQHLPKQATLFCVDPFINSKEDSYDGNYNLRCWKNNLRPWFGDRVFLKKGHSDREAILWGDAVEIDFLFIDGDHSYEAVLLDLESWVPKVRPGGLVSGHDISGKHGPNVEKALSEFCPVNGVKEVHVGAVYSFTGVQTTDCWWFYKPKEASKM